MERTEAIRKARQEARTRDREYLVYRTGMGQHRVCSLRDFYRTHSIHLSQLVFSTELGIIGKS